jgi:hypothetical protein
MSRLLANPEILERARHDAAVYQAMQYLQSGSYDEVQVLMGLVVYLSRDRERLRGELVRARRLDACPPSFSLFP